MAHLNLHMRYTCSLENEIARLRAENRGLIDSILGLAGIPPMRAAAYAAAQRLSGDLSRAESPLNKPKLQRTPTNALCQSQQDGRGRALQPTTGLRRRSWQQVGRALEAQDARAARREREADAETFPRPRNVVSRL